MFAECEHVRVQNNYVNLCVSYTLLRSSMTLARRPDVARMIDGSHLTWHHQKRLSDVERRYLYFLVVLPHVLYGSPQRISST